MPAMLFRQMPRRVEASRVARSNRRAGSGRGGKAIPHKPGKALKLGDVRAPGKLSNAPYGRQTGHRHERQPSRNGRGENVSRRPLLSAERLSDSCAAATRTAGGRALAGQALRAPRRQAEALTTARPAASDDSRTLTGFETERADSWPMHDKSGDVEYHVRGC